MFHRGSSETFIFNTTYSSSSPSIFSKVVHAINLYALSFSLVKRRE